MRLSMGVECKDWEVLSNWRVILTIYEGSIVSFTGGAGTGHFHLGTSRKENKKVPLEMIYFFILKLPAQDDRDSQVRLVILTN